MIGEGPIKCATCQQIVGRLHQVRFMNGVRNLCSLCAKVSKGVVLS